MGAAMLGEDFTISRMRVGAGARASALTLIATMCVCSVKTLSMTGQWYCPSWFLWKVSLIRSFRCRGCLEVWEGKCGSLGQRFIHAWAPRITQTDMVWAEVTLMLGFASSLPHPPPTSLLTE